MKTYFYIILVLLGLTVVMSSCEDDDLSRTLSTEQSKAPVLYMPDGNLEYVMTTENAESPFETFIYTKADFGLPIVVNYTIEIDKTGGDFSNSIDMQRSSNTLYQSISMADFNLIATRTLGYAPEEQGVIRARVRAETANSNVEALYSNIVELTITPYDATIPPIYAVGDATAAGWTPANGVEIPAVDVDLFEGVLSLGATPLSFRFLGQNTGWGPDSYFHDGFHLVESVPAGAVEATPPNQYGEINFQANQAGDYLVTVNLDNGGRRTIKFTLQ